MACALIDPAFHREGDRNHAGAQIVNVELGVLRVECRRTFITSADRRDDHGRAPRDDRAVVEHDTLDEDRIRTYHWGAMARAFIVALANFCQRFFFRPTPSTSASRLMSIRTTWAWLIS